MDPRIIASGINAVLRMAQVGTSLYVEYATDRAIFLPNLPKYKLSRRDILDHYVRSNQLQTHSPFSLVLGSNNRVSNANSIAFDEAFAEMTLRLAKNQEGESEDSDLDALQDKDKQQRIHARAGGELIEQWRKEDRPPSALARAALTLTDIALEFVVSHPSLLGVDSKGERFIRAFAMNLTELVPNSTDAFGAKENFSHRVLATFFRAGLSASLAQAESYLDEAHEQQLFKAIVKPVIDSLPADISEHYFYRNSIDALLGPSASAAFGVVAKHQNAFIGERIEEGTAVGVVVQGLLLNVSEQAGQAGLKSVFSQTGAMQIYTTTLEIAAKHPALFVMHNASAENDAIANYARDIFSLVASKLSQQNLSTGVKTDIAMGVLSITADKASELLGLDASKPWHELADGLIEQVAQAMSMQLKDGKAVRDFLSPRLQSALIKTALNSIQKSPQMLGVKHQNTLAIVSAVAGAIADDKHKLLGDDDWLIIAEVMASVAATDMGRLAFDAINAAAEGEGVEALKSLMSSVVQETIAAATDAWADELNQNVHNFSLHKDTLRKSIVLMLNALRGNIIGLKQTTGLIESYLSSILNYAKTHGDKIGSDTFLSILDTTVATVLMTGDLPNIEQFVSKLEAQT